MDSIKEEKKAEDQKVLKEDSVKAQADTASEDVEAPVVEEEKKAEPVEKDWKSIATYYAAEIENLKRSFARDKADLIKYGSEGILKNVFPVLDNLYLALKAAKGADEDASLKENKLFKGLQEGVEMTAKHFEQTLAQMGVELIESLGKEFDPALHEAMGQMENKEEKDNIVLEEFQKGFKLNGRIIRPAKVIINKVS